MWRQQQQKTGPSGAVHVQQPHVATKNQRATPLTDVTVTNSDETPNLLKQHEDQEKARRSVVPIIHAHPPPPSDHHNNSYNNSVPVSQSTSQAASPQLVQRVVIQPGASSVRHMPNSHGKNTNNSNNKNPPIKVAKTHGPSSIESTESSSGGSATDDSLSHNKQMSNAARQRMLQQQQQQHQASMKEIAEQRRQRGALNQKQLSESQTQLRAADSDQPGPAARILKRELWWRDPPVSERIIVNQKLELGDVTSRTEHRNKNYSPHRSEKRIETRKLEWTNQSGKELYS
jgi:hypothetical protein